MEADTRQHWQFLLGVIMIGDGTKERGRSTGQPSVTNVLPPRGVEGGGGRRWWGGTGGTGSRPWDAVPLIIGGQSVRGDTPRAFFSPSLCPVHGKLIRGNAGKDDRPEADRACPLRCPAPDRFADRINGRGKCTRKWIGLRSILPFSRLRPRIRDDIVGGENN